MYYSIETFNAWICVIPQRYINLAIRLEKKTDECKSQLLHYYPIVAKELGTEVICPLNNDFLGQICSIPIKTKEPFVLKELLYNKYKIEIPVVVTPKQNYLRISFQAYNGVKEIETLIDVIRDIKKMTKLFL